MSSSNSLFWMFLAIVLGIEIVSKLTAKVVSLTSNANHGSKVQLIMTFSQEAVIVLKKCRI